MTREISTPSDLARSWEEAIRYWRSWVLDPSRLPGYAATSSTYPKTFRFAQDNFAMVRADANGLCIFLHRTDLYRTVKVCALGCEGNNEVAVSDHITSIESGHIGQLRLRLILDRFQITGSHGTHQCLVFAPLGPTLHDIRKSLETRDLETEVAQFSMYAVLHGLDFLHQVGVVHTGKRPKALGHRRKCSQLTRRVQIYHWTISFLVSQTTRSFPQSRKVNRTLPPRARFCRTEPYISRGESALARSGR